MTEKHGGQWRWSKTKRLNRGEVRNVVGWGGQVVSGLGVHARAFDSSSN